MDSEEGFHPGKKQTVDEPILQKVADVLGVDAGELRNYLPQTALTVTNNFHDNAVANGFHQKHQMDQFVVNDIKEIVSMFQKQTYEIKALYERLLEEIGTNSNCGLIPANVGRDDDDKNEQSLNIFT